PSSSTKTPRIPSLTRSSVLSHALIDSTAASALASSSKIASTTLLSLNAHLIFEGDPAVSAVPPQPAIARPYKPATDFSGRNPATVDTFFASFSWQEPSGAVQRSVEGGFWRGERSRRSRRAMCGMSTSGNAPAAFNDRTSRGDVPKGAITAWHTLSAAAALAAQDVDPQVGLTVDEVGARRLEHGRNELSAAKVEPKWRAFLRQYRDPMQIVLLVAGGICLFLPGQFAAGILLLALTLFNAALGLNQEGKAEASVAALQKMLIRKTKVRRAGSLSEVDVADLVPGDIVAVEAGDVVPADGRLISAAALEIDESALTGESTPAAKSIDPVGRADIPLGDRTCMPFLNTAVTRGAGQLL